MRRSSESGEGTKKRKTPENIEKRGCQQVGRRNLTTVPRSRPPVPGVSGGVSGVESGKREGGLRSRRRGLRRDLRSGRWKGGLRSLRSLRSPRRGLRSGKWKVESGTWKGGLRSPRSLRRGLWRDLRSGKWKWVSGGVSGGVSPEWKVESGEMSPATVLAYPKARVDPYPRPLP